MDVHVYTIVIFFILFFFHYADSCRYGADPNCAFPCRCKVAEEKCNRDTGICANGCAETKPEGYWWGGDGCRIGNIAYNKQADQDRGGYAHRNKALDGNTNGDWAARSCSHPYKWWRVDLSVRSVILNITIYNRRDCCGERLKYLQISVGNNTNTGDNKVCYTIGNDKSNTYSFNCAEDARIGRYIRLSHGPDSEKDAINFCEIVVMGYSQIDCSFCSGACNGLTGCESCGPGKKLPDCKNECPNGYWGENCQKTCEAHCPGNIPCNVTNGLCPGECEQLYVPVGECNTNLEIPSMGGSLQNLTTTSNSITLKFGNINGVPQGFEQYYKYVLQYNIVIPNDDSNSPQNLTFSHNDIAIEKDTVMFTMDNLIFNTNYSITITPYRLWREEMDAGIPFNTIVKTTCREPTMGNLNVEVKESALFVTFKNSTLLDAGCDFLISYSFNYNCSISKDNVIAEYNIPVLNRTHYSIPFDHLQSTSCNIWILAENNEGYISRSKTTFELVVTTSIQPFDITPSSELIKSGGQRGNNGEAGVISGITIAVLLLACILVVVVVIIVRRKQGKSLNPQHLIMKKKRKEFAEIGEVNQAVEEFPGSDRESNLYEEATEENNGVVTSVSIRELESYIKKQKHHDNYGFKEEYKSLPLGATASHEIANLPENKPKNRFQNIKPYDHTRVLLHTDENGTPGVSDYINANYIPGSTGEKTYIAGQGPKPGTVSDHWRMIWHQNINRVVMCTREVEASKNKCAPYWPPNIGDTKMYGHIKVTLKGVEEYADYCIRFMEATFKGETKRVRQFHFIAWNDKQAPEFGFPLLLFRNKVRSYDDTTTGPMLVHCSAGVGRTGTFIAIDYLLNQAESEGQIDVFRYVTQLRGNRMQMIQTKEQYIYVYESVLEASQTGKVVFSVDNFDHMYHTIKHVQPGNNQSELTRQYTLIKGFASTYTGSTTDAMKPENKSKNRDAYIIPSGQSRVHITLPAKGRNDYINAVFVNGYNQQKAYIATHIPLSDTRMDFWTMVWEQKCSSIVLLGQTDIAENPEGENPYENTSDASGMYWPPQISRQEKYGNICVTLVSEKFENTSIIVRKFNIDYYNSSEEPITVKQYQLISWLNEKLPTALDLAHLLELLDRESQPSSAVQAIVQCLNGADKCGVVLAALYALTRMKTEQEIDVFHAVKTVKVNRSQLVCNMDQYALIYEVIKEYRSLFQTYSNT